jgi:hypothetical protein
MALVIKDRVKQTTTTTGTGTLTLNGTIDGFQTFAAALSDGDTTYYALLEPSTNNWEVGLGTWTEGSSLLARTTVLASSNSGSAVNLTAQAEIFISQPAGKAAFFNAAGDLALNRDPQSSLQAATKQYVDTIAAAGIHYHAPVRVEHPSNLTATYNNGTAGVGATLTNSGTQAALVLDSITMVAADRVLVSNQTDQTQNGVYTVTNIGSGSTNWVLTRATDADSYGPSDSDALGEGDAFFIKEGNTNAGHLDVMTTSGTITFGTTNIVFSEVAETSIYSAGNGLTLTGTEFAADAGTGVTVDGSGINIGQAVETTSDVTFNSVAAALTGNVSGNVTGNVTGNADTATALQTARNIGGVSFDGTASINLPGVNATGNQDTSGNAATATAWATGRTISLTGDVTGSVTNVNGTGNASIATTIAANSVALGTDTTGNYVGSVASGNYVTGGAAGSEGAALTIGVDATPTNTASKVVARDASGNFSAGTITAALSGNASTASALATGRSIALSGDVSGSTTFDGSGNVTITATVADDSHNHVISNVDGLQTALDGKLSTSGKAADSDLLDGFNSSTTEGGNTVAVRNPSGYLFASYFNGSGTFATSGISSGMGRFTGTNGTDTYGRSYTAAAARALLNVADGATNVTNNNQLTNGAGYTTYTANQAVNTSSSPTFTSVYANDWFRSYGATGWYNQTYGGGITMNDTTWVRVYASKQFLVDNKARADSWQELYTAKSGTSVTIDADTSGAFSLSMSGNTTFTFSAVDSSVSVGFILQLTGNGSTVTWPSTVRWAGGTAPDAPASGETDVLVFHTRDGGTNWYGVLSSDAAA